MKENGIFIFNKRKRYIFYKWIDVKFCLRFRIIFKKGKEKEIFLYMIGK